MLIISSYGALTGETLVPTLWQELCVVVVLGLLYNWAIRKHSINLRLGCVYTAVGITISFILLTLGFLASDLIATFFSIPVDETLGGLLAIIPFGICLLVVSKVSEPIGLRVAKKQWLRIDLEPSTQEYEYSYALYLAEKKWTNNWFYLFLYMLIKILPFLLRAPTPGFLYGGFLIVGGSIYYLERAYYILRKMLNRS